MIYTIGITTAYEKYFKENPHPQKIGKNSIIDPNTDYLGGIVFETVASARDFLSCPAIILEGQLIPSTEFSIYGVLADWEKDTLDGRLLKDSPLVKLENGHDST